MRHEPRGALLPPFLAPVVERLEGFAELEQNWDAYGARTIAPEAIAVARALLVAAAERHPYLDRALVPLAVVPVPTGGVQLEWKLGHRELDVEVRPDGSMGYLLVDDRGTHPTYDEQERVTPARVMDQLAALASDALSA